ncbi:patatin-like phospholipase family protein [Hymenobacter tibetensis]|uniref:Patatin-like phospholipase family protein n=1 Tax=Hymenobacter tibetensis TaxID=497967 RepID=A0ABY4D225_9BACT|nr:patatin-like phospholipase family protein [Hymenobacter tibetensis]UOG75176.1 patatin-like phospholipase family protein [Hymenobacter tibetensis]
MATSTLTPLDFTGQPEVTAALQKLTTYIDSKNGTWRVSDITDEATAPGERPHQYVDLVMEGGGMLGIALVGYVYALEQAGIRFLQLGGTSAGAINAMLMAAAGPRHETSTEWLIQELANQNFYEFVDGDQDARDFTADLLKPTKVERGVWGWLKGFVSKADLISDGLQIVDNLRDDQGLHRGQVFRDWLAKLLDGRGIQTIAQLTALRQQVPAGGLCRLDENGRSQPYESAVLQRVAIVAADITTQTKVIFPEMASLYWKNWAQVHPAELVRASMSVPLFFQPYRLGPLPGFGEPPTQAQQYLDAWNALGYTGPIPETAAFMDGGIMSNFPIDLFHDNTQVPASPTFGVKLGVDRAALRPTGTLPQVLGAMFDAARTQSDFDFIKRNSDYRHLVHCLNVDGFNWLDFNMPREEKLKLFAVGVRGAVEFLTKFDWAGYKKLRKEKVHVVHQAQMLDAQKDTPHPEPHAAELEWPGGIRPSYMRTEAPVVAHQ